LLKGKVYGLLLLATPSFKPLPLHPLGLALLVLQRLSIWLWLVVVLEVLRSGVVVVLVVLEPVQD
jgi:hypothetical protein